MTEDLQVLPLASSSGGETRRLPSISQQYGSFNGSSSNLSNIMAKCLQVECFVGRSSGAALSVCWNRRISILVFLRCGMQVPTSKRKMGRSVCVGDEGPLQAGLVVRGRQLVATTDSVNSLHRIAISSRVASE